MDSALDSETIGGKRGGSPERGIRDEVVVVDKTRGEGGSLRTETNPEGPEESRFPESTLTLGR